MSVRYQPKGGMCAACSKRNSNCNNLPFSEMLPVLGEYKDLTGQYPVRVLVVKCSEYQHEEK